MTELTRGVLAGYFAVVLGLCAVIVGLLYGLFARRIPAFTIAVARDPVAAFRSEPLSVLAVVGILAAIAVLVVVIVVFGARYGPTDGNGSTRAANDERAAGRAGGEPRPAESQPESRPADGE